VLRCFGLGTQLVRHVLQLRRSALRRLFLECVSGEHPHFTSINEFRAAHRQALGNLFHQVLQECMSAGLVKLGHVAIDGTKMKANASKHKAMSYERMIIRGENGRSPR
jgi:transposase